MGWVRPSDRGAGRSMARAHGTHAAAPGNESMTSLRQIESSRRNALLSTGPRSEEGKERSRGNALAHGLSGAGVVLAGDERRAIELRAEEWGGEFDATSPH